ncbi:MAG: hypothetical protein DHS20C05_04480 [Hyphococcus sp.]|nr:MAG: hypothetical protein DHS20C05_04480 [Marinicaulis sp.]
MPKVSDEYAQAQKRHILNAAAHCFSNNGYRLTSMADIASKAELSVGALYRYFSTKDVLFQALFSSATQENQTLWDEARKGETAKDRFQLFIDQHFHMINDKECRWALALDARLKVEALDDARLANHVRQSYKTQIDELSTLMLPTGAMKSQRMQAQTASIAIIALLNEARYQALIGATGDLVKFKACILDVGNNLIASLDATT